MQLTKTNPLQIKIIPIPGSTLIFTFILKESKNIARIDISTITYYTDHTRSWMTNSTNSIGTDILSVYTSRHDSAYKVSIKIPEFKNHIRSFIYFRPCYLYEKISVEDVNIIEYSSQKIDKSEIVKIPIPRDPTISEMIDNMVNHYKKDLPKDPINRIFYIRPWANDSFGIVSHNHIEYMKKNKINFEIVNMNWDQLDSINWEEKKNVLLHPFLYTFASPSALRRNMGNFAKLLSSKYKIGGFDVADSNRISQTAVDLINKIDLMMVPSSFAKSVYINSGVTIPVEILPHGILDEFVSNDHISTNNIDIIELIKRKEKGDILILFFNVHSGHRKGADLVKDVMKRIQHKFPNVVLVIKGSGNPSADFPGIRTVGIGSWMDNNDLRLLYDTCDICVSPSRGGGFELNTLEAISRGIPTLVPNGCCFLDLIKYFIPINLSNKEIQPLPGNPVHTGYGCEVDINDFEIKLVDVINRLDYWKSHFRENSKVIKEEYSWRNVVKILDGHLRHYGFID